jgi:cAMP phosphodiesterase
MKLQVLGCAGTISPEARTSAFLVNDTFLLDGGTICSALDPDRIARIRQIFISHPHFDHIKGIPSLAETLIFMETAEPVTIVGSPATVDAIRSHIMNNVVWPDFSRLPSAEQPVVRYRAIAPGEALDMDGVTVTPCRLHGNPADYGYRLTDGSTTLLYTSDIGADARLETAGPVPDALIIEVSFPDDKRDLAARTGHITPSLLKEMLGRLPSLPRAIYVTHIKTYFREEIVRQMNSLAIPGLSILADGDIITV